MSNLGVWMGKSEENKAAEYEIEAFYDLGCPYSRKAYNNFQTVLAKHGDRIRVRAYLIALPVHYSAFLAAVAAQVVLAEKGAEGFFKFVEAAFKAQEELLFNDKTLDKTRAEMLAALAGIASDAAGVDKEGFAAKCEEWTFKGPAFKVWQYSVARGLGGTPKYIINGFVNSAIQSAWGVDEWEKNGVVVAAKNE
eukprot:TRINITY_DN66461_c2_g1_i1.p2 TRINITY_DN66461_c2_g1~~TRINITY_DN66461_c2_g1_i1.p2  ORF type:complete len:205 (-),score=119.36 TRINITY_DN66461_c2_g1_i1:89-670(-)